MALEEYRGKRDFARTQEPRGGEKTGGRDPVYVVQRHQARRLHYDLRLEMGGVLRSWAVPKEPPTTEGVKRLAVQVEDHPLDYADFEGVIPEGEYGAGKVEIWDRGTFQALEVEERKIIAKIEGRRLKGEYCLLKLRPRKGQEDVNWLFFKMKG